MYMELFKDLRSSFLCNHHSLMRLHDAVCLSEKMRVVFIITEGFFVVLVKARQ